MSLTTGSNFDKQDMKNSDVTLLAEAYEELLESAKKLKTPDTKGTLSNDASKDLKEASIAELDHSIAWYKEHIKKHPHMSAKWDRNLKACQAERTNRFGAKVKRKQSNNFMDFVALVEQVLCESPDSAVYNGEQLDFGDDDSYSFMTGVSFFESSIQKTEGFFVGLDHEGHATLDDRVHFEGPEDGNYLAYPENIAKILNRNGGARGHVDFFGETDGFSRFAGRFWTDRPNYFSLLCGMQNPI